MNVPRVLLLVAAGVLLGALGILFLPARVPDLLLRQGAFHELPLPPGSSDVLVSGDGTLAAIATATFDREAGRPARVLQAVDPQDGRVVWRRSLPAPACCAFPVLAITPGGDMIALGGAEQTFVYNSKGMRLFAAGLNDGRLHSAVDVDNAGRGLVIGEWEGTLAAFDSGRGRLWMRSGGESVMAVAVSGSGGAVAAALRDRVLLLRLRDGAALHDIPYGPARIAAVSVSADGALVGLVWKREDGRMVAEVLAGGRRLWTRVLGPGSVPLLQMDEQGRWLAVGDLLGRQAVLLGPRGEATWRASGPGRVAVAVAEDGNWFAVARGAVIEVRMLPSGRIAWRGRFPGTVHLLQLAGRRLAALGSRDPGAGIPDRAWFAEVLYVR